MKRNSLWAVALLLCSVLFLSSCTNNDDGVSNSETISFSHLAISDPEIKKEIEFMREKKIITESLYQKWLKSPRQAVLDETDILVDEKGTKEHRQSYLIYTPLSNDMMAKGMMTDIEGIDRKNIQDLMKPSNRDLADSALAISDPQVKKEIEFMKEKKMITESLYQKWLTSKRSDVLDEWDVMIDEKGTVRHDGAYRVMYTSETYKSNGMNQIDDVPIDRRVIQDLMNDPNLKSIGHNTRFNI